MVLKRESVANKKMLKSQSLKFGMDRILSEDVSSARNNCIERCSVNTPCAECVSSLYRCCLTSNPSEVPICHRSQIPVSRSLGPFKDDSLGSTSHANPKNLSEKGAKRKKSWSRAVFSNLQRKGLEKRFQLQKYITKPDRRQLAATLGLTDAQVKVWFQNRRMKWRHSKKLSKPNVRNRETRPKFSLDAITNRNQNYGSETY